MKISIVGRKALGVLAVCMALANFLFAQSFKTLVDFDIADGSSPTSGSLIKDAAGNLYGSTSFGGTSGFGEIFKITNAGNLITLYSFCSQSGCPDGMNPNTGLVRGSDGNFYGTTREYGETGGGTVFKMTPDGSLTTLHSFCSLPGCADGFAPLRGLMQASDGNLYGTTSSGGPNFGVGTIFKVSLQGEFTTLYTFCQHYACKDGAEPEGSLVEAADGNLYGTTFGGGSKTSGFCPHWYGCGTIFRITASGQLTTLYSFCFLLNCIDGMNPSGALFQAANGNLYGTTMHGGAHATRSTGGTIFEITPDGEFTSVYNFCAERNCADGLFPMDGVIQATDGNFYGTTNGANFSDCPGAGCGTVFAMTPAGVLTTLHVFKGTDGMGPEAGLLQVSNGGLIGTTSQGGGHGAGTVFVVHTLPRHIGGMR